mgnify:CR=1 FL=1
MPRIALIADIHANLEAFQAVLSDIAEDRVDRILCLGDIVGYGPDPAACVDLAFTACDRIVLGNHDEAVVREEFRFSFNERARASLDFTADALSAEHKHLLATLPDRARVDGVSLAHASFGAKQYEYLYNDEAAERSIRGLRTRIGAVGHTHLPSVVSGRQGLAGVIDDLRHAPLAPNVVTPLARDAVSIVNPGSVGQPRDRNPDASYAVLDTDALSVQLRRVAYDVANTQRKIAKLGLPAMLAERLLVGA